MRGLMRPIRLISFVNSGETITPLENELVTRRNPITNHFSFITIPEHSLLVIEQPFLTPEAAAVTTERTIRSDDAMTWNNDGEHVLAIGATDCAAHLDITQFLRHPRIRARFAGWN